MLKKRVLVEERTNESVGEGEHLCSCLARGWTRNITFVTEATEY